MDKKLQRFIKNNKIEFVDLKFTDIRGLLRHISFPIERLGKAFKQGIGIDGSSVGFARVERSDLVIKPDPSFYFIDPFYSAPTLSLFADLYLGDGKTPNPLFPRTILKNAIEKIKRIAENILVLSEHEFYIFKNIDFSLKKDLSFFRIESLEAEPDERKYNAYHIAPPEDIYTTFRVELVRLLRNAGVPVKYHHHEVGKYGQAEIETDFTPALRAADNITLVKYFSKNLARKEGVYITFMPKPLQEEAGNGLHLHVKMFKKGKNIFAGEKEPLSDLCRYCIGGIIKNARALCAITNPSTNSYRRLWGGLEAPRGIFYSFANRNAAIRIPGYVRTQEDRRFEYRIPDAVMNPYTGIAGIITACLHGIDEKIEPERVKNQKLPLSLREALEALRKNPGFLTRQEIFPKEFIDLWIEIKEKEVEEIESYPTPQDYVYYFNS